MTVVRPSALRSTVAARLWAVNADLATAAVDHPFVRGLADGTLAMSAFKRYVGQDACLLDAFARAYALALAYCPDPAERREFFELLSGVFDELRLHASYAAAWQVDVTATEPIP